ncbi:MAG: type II toxin-antitoxin system VapC family toxin [Acidobacteria bacterium]|nr:type II toxin-antitoxin system VapC family toxin [Acidobacteriota bacterium]
MTIPDVNILVHAYDADFRQHQAARDWWEEALNLQYPVGLPWVVTLGFLRIVTNRSILARPLPVAAALDIVRSWLKRPGVRILVPGERHGDIVFGLLEELGAAGNLTTDAHLAALAIEYRAEIASTDADFARFPGLRWFNPLSSRKRLA